ncbi:hypothetical protein JCM10212_006041 [Sporobolomyces blumeae]
MNSSMPDNANPTIHKTPASTRRRAPPRSVGLNLNDDQHFLDLQLDLERPTGLERCIPKAISERDVELAGAVQDLEDIDQDEIFDLIRSISDPEHPLTLEQLAVVSSSQITVHHSQRPTVLVEFTPTIPHCSMATLIGLSLRVRLLRSLPERFKVDIRVKEGTHQSEHAVNKQLNDKERVAAALENNHLLSVVQQCLSTADQKSSD